MKLNKRLLVVGAAAILLFLGGGCKKRTPVGAPPPSQQQLAAPTITLTAQPPIIAEGASTTLNWTATNATGVTIETVGQFPPQGSTVVSPKASTTYVAVATGAGGTVSAQSRVTVTPAPVTTTTTTETPRVDETDQGLNVEQIFKNEVQDIFFEFDRAEVTAEYRDILRQNAEVLLRRLPRVSIMIEGHCDERGTEEYNLGLGDKRANSARDYLVSLGVSATRIKTISYGEERPFDPAHTEEAWAKNRRAHFVLIKP